MKYISREGWGARAPKSLSHNITPEVGGVTLHWEGPHMGDLGHNECYRKIKTIQNFHMDSRGWNDIAYSLMVCQHGYVFECRGTRVRTAANGTNAGNQNWYAVCTLIGEGDTLTNAAKSGIVDAIAYLRKYGGAGGHVNGHMDQKATACPGPAIMSWLRVGMPVAHDPEPPKASPTRKAPAPVASRAKGYPVPKRDLYLNQKRFMTGEDVKWLQAKLHLKEDGIFGPKTSLAVKSFQRLHRLKADGIVGPVTREVLKRV